MADNVQDLNERQWLYLETLFYFDQEAERQARSAWSRGEDPPPASQYRWIPYELGPLAYEPELRTRLRRLKLVDPGTGATWKALESRGLVLVEGQVDAAGELYLRITREGRRRVRERLGVQTEPRLSRGTLREWHWRAMAAAYAAGEAGLPHDDIVGGYGGIGWNTWLRLRGRAVAGQLVEEFKGLYQGEGEWRRYIRLTPLGRGFYEREYSHYRGLYPDVDAPAPESAQEADDAAP